MTGIYKHLMLFALLLIGADVLAIEDKNINWQEEIDGLKRELLERHVDLFFQTDSVSFYRDLDAVAEAAEGKSVLQIAMMLQQEVAKLGDANTMVNYNYLIDTRFILPFHCYWFDDGLYAISYWKDYEELEGKKIVAINGFPIQHVVDSLATLVSDASPSRIRFHIPRMLIWGQVLEFFGFVQLPDIKIELEDAEGKQSSLIINLPAPESDRVSVGPDPLPLGWQDQSSFFRDRYFPDQRLYYIQYNKCWSREAEVEFGSGASALFMPSFEDFEKTALKTLKKKSIEKLVLDLRFNNGGNAQQWTGFIRKVQKTRIGEKAKIYLLVGRKTSAAAIVNALDVIEAFDVQVVGEDSGGKPNHYGGLKRFVLTTSNLVVSYSTKYITLVEENPPAIIPDIPVSESFAGFMAGEDEALEAVLDHPAK